MPRKAKRILIVYPHNFFEQSSGVNKMFYHLAKCLNQLGFVIDLFALKNFESRWDKGYVFDHNIVDQLYLYDFAQKQEISFSNKLLRKFESIFQQPTEVCSLIELPDYSSPMMKGQFLDIIKKNNYSYILFGYVYWANLIKDVDLGKTIKVISINDWLTVQMKDYFGAKVDTASFMKDEINKINLFDVAIEVSMFEHVLFKQLASHPKHYLVPILMEPKKVAKKERPAYDLLFVAHNNPYNISGIKWFLSEVLPLLPTAKLLIVGKVNQELGKLRNRNVTQVASAKTLDDIYQNSKLVICPLFGGTGLKVKIIEAIASGTPVVCTAESLIGFPNELKTGILVANDPGEFAQMIKEVLSDKSLLRSLSKDAKIYFDTYFNVETAGEKLGKIFNP